MPKGGHYFDPPSCSGAALMDAVTTEAPRMDLKKARESLDEIEVDPADLEHFRNETRHYYENTDYSLLAEGLQIGLPAGEWIAYLTNTIIQIRQDPDYVHEMFDLAAEEAIRRLRPFLDAIEDRCDVILVTCCDFGNQQNEFIDPDMFREFYIAPYKKVNDYIHKHSSMKTMFHVCGAVSRLIPHFIEAGVDILNPVQTMARGMDPEDLKRRFGDKIVFWGGGAETQTTLPLGSAADVAAEVKERMRIFKPGGGFVFNPVHNIQDLVPPENIVAAYDAAREAGLYNKAR
jgi:uroporphyrinogen-III decarboxylase